MHAPALRRTAVVVGSLSAVAALVLTCATTASAAPRPPAKTSTATAQGFSVTLPGAPAAGTPAVTASNTGTQDPQRATTPSIATPVLSVGVATATAVAKRNGVSFACAGVVQPGGSVTVGATADSCTARGTGATGIRVDLAKLTGLSLPVSIGDVDLFLNAVTAVASQDATGTQGIAKPVNLRLSICPAIKTGDACPVQLIRVPILVQGTPNEDLLPAVLNALSAGRLGAVGTALSAALAPVLTLKTNVQTTTAGVFKVVGVQVGTTLGASVDLGVASVGPNV